MIHYDPIALDRDLARAADTVRSWRGRLRRSPDFADDPFPFYRARLSATQFEQVRELPAEDPLRAPLLRAVYRLLEQRVNRWWHTRVHQLRYQEQHAVHEPIRGKFTLAELLLGALRDAERRRGFWQSFTEHARPLSDAQAVLWQRRQEVASRLGLSSPDDLELRGDNLYAVAEEFVGAARGAIEESRRAAPFEWLAMPLAKRAVHGLPVRLNERSLAEWFREGRLLEDLPLRSWPLPELIAPASCLRALDELGQEFRRAAAPKNQPFVVAFDPYGLENYRLGFCFASLFVNPAFVERRLGLARPNQIDHRREIARSLLIELVVRSIKVILRPAALRSGRELIESYPHWVSTGLGPHVPSDLAHVWLRLRSDDSQRLAGAALGWQMAQRLVETHDEDWFRNPRAIDQLRSEAAIPPKVELDAQGTQAALMTALADLAACS